jgi:hypothetical protein
MTDWPLLFVSVISLAALSRTGKGRTEGPDEKLYTRINKLPLGNLSRRVELDSNT